ncbi:hypothetical protein [Rhodoblastus sp.]|uniref:hypothetical protein n=1 Tax=Rhodoblastus sp. TaxID=1962975 RepID=UPI003F94A9E5
MKTFPFFIVALSFLVAGSLAARAEGAARTYEGTVGNSGVVLALNGDGADVDGQYFYRVARFDIDLAGEWKNGTLTLESRNTGDRMTLHAEGSGLAGGLTTGKGRQFSVALHPAVLPADAPGDFPDGLSLYQRLQLLGLRLVPDREETMNGKKIRWFRESVTGTKLFRLEDGYPKLTLDAVNLALTRDHWNALSAWFACPGADGGAGIEGAEAGRLWLGPDYIPYVWHANYDCAGAAHPDFSDEGHSYDARTGRELALDEVIPFGKGPVPAKDSDAWLDYRSKIFAPEIVALMKGYYPKEMKPPGGSDESCDYSDPNVWSFPAWSLNKKGLWLGASFPRYARVCDNADWSVLPWSALAEIKEQKH